MDRRHFIAASAIMTPGAVAAQAADSAKGPIRIVGLCCSPRQGKTTHYAVKEALAEAAKVDSRVETELIELAGMKIDGAPAAGLPSAFGDEDQFAEVSARLVAPQVKGLIVGTPTYFGNMSYLCKIFLDRCIALRKEFALADKVAGVIAVGAARNGGQELAIASVQAVLMTHEMIVVGDGRPTAHRGATVWSGIEGGVEADTWGLSTARNLGRRVAAVALGLRAPA